MELVREVVAGPAGALAEAVAPLNHEAVDDAVEDHAVVKRRFTPFAARRIPPFLAALGEPDEVGDGVRGLLVEEPDRELAFGGGEMRVSS